MNDAAFAAEEAAGDNADPVAGEKRKLRGRRRSALDLRIELGDDVVGDDRRRPAKGHQTHHPRSAFDVSHLLRVREAGEKVAGEKRFAARAGRSRLHRYPWRKHLYPGPLLQVPRCDVLAARQHAQAIPAGGGEGER